jgi:hypothetical protein
VRKRIAKLKAGKVKAKIENVKAEVEDGIRLAI